MYGPPGTGKTLLARACAAQTDATFLKLAGPQLVQMFIGDGAKLVRDCFALAKEKAPSIIFIDELDAVGTKRFDSDKSGDREVQRTMLELLNQLDGFASDDRVKVLAATNRVDVLDPALLRSGRLDRKIEFPLPNEEARAQILRIHSRKMTVDEGVNWPELARSTDEFGGAQLKAVCVEAGMIALRNGHSKISHEHYVDAIAEVQAKKKVRYPLAMRSLISMLTLTVGYRQLLRIRDSRERCIAWHHHCEGRDCGPPSIDSIVCVYTIINDSDTDPKMFELSSHVDLILHSTLIPRSCSRIASSSHLSLHLSSPPSSPLLENQYSPPPYHHKAAIPHND